MIYSEFEGQVITTCFGVMNSINIAFMLNLWFSGNRTAGRWKTFSHQKNVFYAGLMFLSLQLSLFFIIVHFRTIVYLETLSIFMGIFIELFIEANVPRKFAVYDDFVALKREVE